MWRALLSGAAVLLLLCLAGAERSNSVTLPADKNTSLRSQLAQAFEGRPGSALLLHAGSGAVLAAHRPDWAQSRAAAPGSAIKPFVLQALLARQDFDPRQQVFCPRRMTLAGRRLDCSHPPAPPALDAVAALAYSCNRYFAEAALRFPAGELERALSGYFSGHGEPATVRIRNSNTPEQRQQLALGVANIALTPMALARGYIKLLHESDDSLQRGLRDAVRFGTANTAALEELTVSGKTGTAPNPAGGYHAWFVGHAPAEQPEIVLVVFLERGRGGADAGRMARTLLEAYSAQRSRR